VCTQKQRFLSAVLVLVFLSQPLLLSQSVTLSSKEYTKLMTLLEELSKINEELQTNIEISYESIISLSNEITIISDELESLRSDYQASLSKQELYSARFSEAEALLQQAEESLTKLKQYYEEQLKKERISKMQWQIGLGSIAVAEFLLLTYLFVRVLTSLK